MSGFKNPFIKKPANPFADPSVTQEIGQQQQPVQGLGNDDETVPQASGGAWGQPSMGSGAWGSGGAKPVQPAQQDSSGWGEIPIQPSQPTAPQQPQQQQTSGIGWGFSSKPKAAPQQQQPQGQSSFPAPQQPTWGQNFGFSSSKPKEQDEVNMQQSASMRKREQDLQRREKDLKALETQIQKNGGQIQKKNFPPLIPCCYHSIKNDIPEGGKTLMRMVLVQFFYTIGVLLFNFIAVTVGFAPWGALHAVPWVLALITLLIGCPLAWFLWYRRLYFAIKNNGVFGYIMYLCFNVCTIVFSVYAAIAPPIPSNFIRDSQQSFAGIIPAIQLFQRQDEDATKKNVGGAFYIIGFGLWVLLAIYSVFLEIRVGRHFRGVGGAAKVQRGARTAQQAASRFDRI